MRGQASGGDATREQQLKLRDALLVALTFSVGVYEAVCFLSFGKVFTAFQTGNVVFLGLITAGTRPPAGPEPVTVIVSLVAFAVGAAVAMTILRWFNGEEEERDDEVVDPWPRRVTVVLTVSLVAQVAFLVQWLADPPETPSDLSAAVLIGLSAFAMGLQMNAVRRLHVPGVSTTAVTATYIGLISGVVTRGLQPRAALRLLAVLVGVAAGALAGAWLVADAHTWAPVPALLVTAVVVGVAWVALPPTPSARPQHSAAGGRAAPARAESQSDSRAPRTPTVKEMP